MRSLHKGYAPAEWKQVKQTFPKGKGVPGVSTRPPGNRGVPALEIRPGVMINETSDIARAKSARDPPGRVKDLHLFRRNKRKSSICPWVTCDFGFRTGPCQDPADLCKVYSADQGFAHGYTRIRYKTPPSY